MSPVIGNGRLIPAVCYLRRSTVEQEGSIREQRSAVKRYADQHGYEILREYCDDGISGDDTAKRSEFRRMLADAQEKGDFKAILVWDQDRFGRFSPQEGGFLTYPLAKAGIQLVTTNKGPIDWNEFTEWLTYSVNQHAKHQFLKDLSRNVTRGQVEAAKAGSWIGSIPRGYGLEGPRKARKLVPGDASDVALIKRIFREYVDEGRSLNEIADRLNESKVPTSKGGPWRYDAVRCILANPAYVGTYQFNRNSDSKYTSYRNGELVPKGSHGPNDESDWIVIPNNHEALIDQKTFDRAQTIIAKGKTGRNRYTPETNPFIFSGLLRCGECGSPLWAFETSRGVRRYECSSKQESKDCKGTSVREAEILRVIAEYLDNWLGLDGEAIGVAAQFGHLKSADELPAAFAEVKKLIMPHTNSKPDDRKRLEKQADQLQTHLAKAKANLVLLDADNIPAAQERIRGLAEQRAEIVRELNQTKPTTQKDINQIVLEVMDSLYMIANCFRALGKPVDDRWEVHGLIESRAPKTVRKMLKQLSHIVCHTTKTGEGTRTRHVFDGGEIVFAVPGITSNLNLHDLVQSQAAYR